MKVCDRHADKRAIDTVHFEVEGDQFDLCDECKYALLNFLSGEKKELEPKDRKSLVRRVLGG